VSSSRPIKRIGELALFSLSIALVNLLFPANPGFFRGPFNPYILLALIAAAYYGKYFGLASLGLSAFFVLLPLPAALELLRPGAWRPAYYAALGPVAPVPLAVGLAAAYLVGLIQDSRSKELARTRERMRLFARHKGELKRRQRQSLLIQGELEQRILRQRESITALYAQIGELYSLNLAKALQAVLEIVQRFSGATRASLWQLDTNNRQLRLAAQAGWEAAEEQATSLPLDGSIEGWVVRNNLAFSIKMVAQYEHLARLDRGRNILTLPVSAGRRLWGALTIEEMPFIKYNPYTEKLVAMILALAAPALERALEYEAVLRQTEVNPHTGLASFSQFYSLLSTALDRSRLENGTLSVVVWELANYAALLKEYGREESQALLGRFARSLKALSNNQAFLFHYKEENQLAAVYPGLDYDGASLFSLETLSLANQGAWKVRQQPVQLEMILGYASVGEKALEAGSLLQLAENLLEMQKL
jgi:GGDEF domain-containing protein